MIWKKYTVQETRFYLLRDLFDVGIGVCDGVEVCKLVRTFLLEKNIEFSNKSKIGLYRCAGSSNFRKKSGTQLGKIEKKLQRFFWEYDSEKEHRVTYSWT